MRHAILATVLVLFFVASPPARAAQDRGDRPNVVVFMIDDLGWTDLGCYGSDLYETPAIDQLAAEGLRFTDAYAACTVCSPTRAALMTGMSPGQTNVTDWIDGMWAHRRDEWRAERPLMPPDWTQQLEKKHTTLAEALGAVGYKTAHIGKWHLTQRSNEPSVVEPYYPENQGFDVNIAGNQWGAPGSYYWPYRRGNRLGLSARVANFPPEGRTRDRYLTDMLTDQALKLIDRWEDEPFFLHFAHYAVHTPIQGKKALVEAYKKKLESGDSFKHDHPEYAAMIESVDHSVRRVRARLEELGLAEDTVIIFTSDNGGLEHRRGGPTDNDPLRAGKGSPYEGGVRVPTIVAWPGVTPGGVESDEPVITYDLYPTILEMTGADGDASHNENVEGVALAPVLKDPDASLDREALYWHYPHYHSGGSEPYSAVRAGDWRLVHFYDGDRVELYNLADDLGETNDLAEERPEKAAELKQMLDAYRDRVDAQPPRKYPDYKGD